MKRVLAAALAVLFSISLLQAQENCLPLRRITQDNLVFRGGERMNYKIHFKSGVVNAYVAKAEISLDSTVLNGKPVYAARVYARTANFFDKFFNLREDFRSWFSAGDLAPEKFHRYSKEGRYTATNDYKFVRDTGEPYISAEIETSKKPRFTKEIPLGHCTYDPVTLFFAARNMDMTRVRTGVSYPMTFAVADDVYTINFIYSGKEKRKVDGIGEVSTMKFTVQVLDGDVFTGGSDMVMWFSDDDNRVLVGFEAPLKIGVVQGRLISAGGLRHGLAITKKN